MFLLLFMYIENRFIVLKGLKYVFYIVFAVKIRMRGHMVRGMLFVSYTMYYRHHDIANILFVHYMTSLIVVFYRIDLNLTKKKIN